MAKSGFKPLSKSPEPLYKLATWGEIVDMLARVYPDQASGRRLNRMRDSGADRLILTPQASKELMNHFYWNMRHPNNLCEQQAGLAGYLFKDPQTNRFIAVAEFVIPAIAKNRTPVGAYLSVDDTADVQCELNVINQNLRKMRDYGVFTKLGDAQMLGYVHSHPGDLDVFVSSTDQQTHRTNYGNGTDSLGISLVVNPHRRLARAYGGPEIREMEQIWFFAAGDYERFTGKPVRELVYVDVPESGPHSPWDGRWEDESWDKYRYMQDDLEEAKKKARAGAASGGAAEEEKEDEKKAACREAEKPAEPVTPKEPMKPKEPMTSERPAAHITTPAGGTWPHLHGVPDGLQKGGKIECIDIRTGGTRHYSSVEEYRRDSGCREPVPEAGNIMETMMETIFRFLHSGMR